jgi:hypothetical protein
MKPRILAAVAALIAAISLTVVFTDDNGPAGHKRTVTIHVGTDAQRDADKTLTVPASAVAQAKTSELGHHDGLKSESPEGLTATQANRLADAQDAAARNDQLPIVTPDAAPSQRGCVSRFVGSYSSRRGVAPRLFVLHYTVSPNRPGWSDVDSVVALFANPAFQASSNYVIDGEGHCAYIVRESDKAWTQAAANPFAISAEIINTGREGVYIEKPGLAVLARVIADAAKRWNIPIRQGAVSGCVPTRSGIVTHQMLGLCGGGHVDITPYPLQPVIDAAAALSGPKPVSAHTQTVCRKYAWFGVPGSKLALSRSSSQRALHGVRRRYLIRNHIACSPKGVASRL